MTNRDCPVCGPTDESKAGLVGPHGFVCSGPCYATYHDRMRAIREAQPGGRWSGPIEGLDQATVAWFRERRKP